MRISDWSSDVCSSDLKVGMRTIDRVKKRFVEEGIEAVLERRATQRVYETKIDGDTEAKLVTLCCSQPPTGFAKWSLRLLADKMVDQKYRSEELRVGNACVSTCRSRWSRYH